MSKRIMVIPDTQVKPGVDLEYLSFIGHYAVDIKPDVIVQIGDFADMPSLSSYDVGTKAFEGRTYKEDTKSVHKAMDTLMSPIYEEQHRLMRNKMKRWNPKLILTLGNHENRINKAINFDRKLDGLISTNDLKYETYGWEVHPFLDVVVEEGIAFSHYFSSGVMGRPVTSAQALLTKKHMSCFAGHQQGRQIAYGQRADGKEIAAIIAGSCYEHDEDYLSSQTNNHWRGLYILNDVKDGAFDDMPVSLKYLRKKYG